MLIIALQWRSQGHSFRGGEMRTPRVRVILGGSKGKFWNLEHRKCDFLHFPSVILQKKILLLRITHNHGSPLNFSSDFIFSQGWSFNSLGGQGGWAPPAPLVYATVALENDWEQDKIVNMHNSMKMNVYPH